MAAVTLVVVLSVSTELADDAVVLLTQTTPITPGDDLITVGVVTLSADSAGAVGRNVLVLVWYPGSTG